MKNLKLIIIAFSLFTVNVFATSFDPIHPIKATEQLRTEIIAIIGTHCPYEYSKNECKGIVIFKVNSENKIEILKVISKNTKTEPFLRSKLNYKKVSKPPYEIDQVFLLPLKMIKES